MASTAVTWLTAQRDVPRRKQICSLRLVWAVIGHHTQGQTAILLFRWQLQYVGPPEDLTFLSQFSPNRHRHTLTWGTASRSLTHFSWDTLYIYWQEAYTVITQVISTTYVDIHDLIRTGAYSLRMQVYAHVYVRHSAQEFVCVASDIDPVRFPNHNGISILHLSGVIIVSSSFSTWPNQI
jgi:hypothetical protein